MLAQEWRTIEDAEGPRRLLVKLAKQLTTRDWSTTINATPDFIVYAVDVELADLERNLRAAKSRRR